MTVISYINIKGGIKSDLCNKIVSDICYFCITRKLLTLADHILGVSDNEANKHFRILHDVTHS